MKNNLIYILIFLCFSCSGCCFGSLTLGMSFNVDEKYRNYIGVRVAPKIFPAAILSNGRNIEPYIHMPYNMPYGKFKAMVPEGTIITIVHIIRAYGPDDGVYDSVKGSINVPGYNGLVVIGICDGKKIPTLEQCIDLKEYEILGK